MKQLIATLIFTCSVAALSAQHFRIEPQVNLFSVKQTGWIYTPIGNQSPPIGYTPIEADGNATIPGFGCTVWYSLNFGTPLYEYMSYGVESGFILNGSRQDQSLVPPEEISQWNVRIPVMAGLRLGTANYPLKGKYGFGISAGMEMIKTAISNETGTYFIPKIQVIAGLKKLFIGMAFYPVSIMSYYNLNGEIKDRVTTSFFEFQVRTAINWYPKRYRAHKKFVA